MRSRMQAARLALPCAADPEKWYADEGNAAAVAEAKAGCTACSFRLGCLSLALANGERWGVWGGLSALDRGYSSGVAARPAALEKATA